MTLPRISLAIIFIASLWLVTGTDLSVCEQRHSFDTCFSVTHP